MAYDFPSSPTNGQKYTPAGGGPTYVYNGYAWDKILSEGPEGPAGPTGAAGPTGPAGVDGAGEVEEAPVNGTPYSRQDAGWVTASSGGGLPLTGGTLTGPLQLPNGSVTTAALNFGTANTGLWGNPTDLYLATAGVNRVAITAGYMVSYGALMLPATGNAVTTAMHFGTSITGLYGDGTAVNISVNATRRLQITATEMTMAVPVVLPSSGTAAASMLNFGTPGTGLYGLSSTINMSVSGTARLQVTAGYVNSTVPLYLPGNPTENTHAATKAYVDATTVRIATISTSAPSGGIDGDVWYQVT